MSSDSENDELDGDNAFAAAAEGTANEEVDNLFGSSDEDEAIARRTLSKKKKLKKKSRRR